MRPIPPARRTAPRTSPPSYEDAQARRRYLTEQGCVDVYRLPSESQWELAAGHMPREAGFSRSVNDGRTSVEKYADVTRGAHGAANFRGNAREWAFTVRSEENGVTLFDVKGGSLKSAGTDPRTAHRGEGRSASLGNEDADFRAIIVLCGDEPESKRGLPLVPGWR